VRKAGAASEGPETDVKPSDSHPLSSATPAGDAEFDRYAGSYGALHQKSIRMSGEPPDYFAAYKIDWIAKQPDTMPDKAIDVLDFGCGVGGSLGHLQRGFPRARLCGADVSGASLDHARSAHPEVTLRLIENGRLDWPDASFDLAMAACVFHHIPPAERLAWASELRRVLRPGGRLFLFEHNPANPLTRKVVRECAFDKDAILLPHKETLSLLQEAGFSATKLDYIVFFPRALAALRPLERALAWLPLGAQYVASATVA
jgi:SAM-dependent methyltransferase